jgi:hypothetical protein
VLRPLSYRVDGYGASGWEWESSLERPPHSLQRSELISERSQCHWGDRLRRRMADAVEGARVSAENGKEMLAPQQFLPGEIDTDTCRYLPKYRRFVKMHPVVNP